MNRPAVRPSSEQPVLGLAPTPRNQTLSFAAAESPVPRPAAPRVVRSCPKRSAAVAGPLSPNIGMPAAMTELSKLLAGDKALCVVRRTAATRVSPSPTLAHTQDAIPALAAFTRTPAARVPRPESSDESRDCYGLQSKDENRELESSSLDLQPSTLDASLSSRGPRLSTRDPQPATLGTPSSVPSPSGPLDPELLEVIDAWPFLPENLRSAILAMIAAITGGQA